jgi:hypothetical protein
MTVISNREWGKGLVAIVTIPLLTEVVHAQPLLNTEIYNEQREVVRFESILETIRKAASNNSAAEYSILDYSPPKDNSGNIPIITDEWVIQHHARAMTMARNRGVDTDNYKLNNVSVDNLIGAIIQSTKDDPALRDKLYLTPDKTPTSFLLLKVQSGSKRVASDKVLVLIKGINISPNHNTLLSAYKEYQRIDKFTKDVQEEPHNLNQDRTVSGYDLRKNQTNNENSFTQENVEQHAEVNLRILKRLKEELSNLSKNDSQRITKTKEYISSYLAVLIYAFNAELAADKTITHNERILRLVQLKGYASKALELDIYADLLNEIDAVKLSDLGYSKPIGSYDKEQWKELYNLAISKRLTRWHNIATHYKQHIKANVISQTPNKPAHIKQEYTGSNIEHILADFVGKRIDSQDEAYRISKLFYRNGHPTRKSIMIYEELMSSINRWGYLQCIKFAKVVAIANGDVSDRSGWLDAMNVMDRRWGWIFHKLYLRRGAVPRAGDYIVKDTNRASDSHIAYVVEVLNEGRSVRVIQANYGGAGLISVMKMSTNTFTGILRPINKISQDY